MAAPGDQYCLRRDLRTAPQARGAGDGPFERALGLDRSVRPGFGLRLDRDRLRDPEPAHLALCPAIYSVVHCLPDFAGGPCPGPARELADPGRKHRHPPLDRDRVGIVRPGCCREAGLPDRGGIMTAIALVIVLVALIAHTAGQIFLKHAMASTHGAAGFRSPGVMVPFAIGIALMTTQ